jgi:hypothetical protein
MRGGPNRPPALWKLLAALLLVLIVIYRLGRIV